MSVLRAYLPLLLILLVAAAVRVPLVQLEFGRNGDGTGSFYGIIARNYLIRDNAASLWMPVLSVGDATHPPTLYAHHPPTVPLLTALSVTVVGDTDVAVRLPAALFTLGSVALLYGVILRCGSRVGATVGAMVLAFVPMSLRFGQMPDVVNSQLVFACLLTLAMYLRCLEVPSVNRIGWFLGAFTFAALTDWPAFFLVPVLGVHLLLARPAGWVRCGVSLLTCALVLFGGLYVWISVATGDWELIVRQFLNRATQTRTDDARVFSWSTWVSGVWVYHRTLHTVPLLLAGAVGAVLACRGARSSRLALLTALALGWAGVHAVVGRQGVLNHDWWWWPMTLALSLSAATLADSVVSAWTRHRTLVMGGVVAATSALCLWWAITEVRYLLSPQWVHGAIPEYTPRELGVVVRETTPQDRAVMLFEGDAQPYMQYNLRRPVVFAVWDVDTFHRRLALPEADLFYSFTQRLDAPPATFVFPKQYADKGLPLLQYLRGQYPETVTGRFYVFDLTRPREPQRRLN